VARMQGILTDQDSRHKTQRVFDFVIKHKMSLEDVADILLGSPGKHIEDEPLDADVLARLEHERSDVNNFADFYEPFCN
jgi:hypothetical protein